MRGLILLSVDVALIIAATVSAFVLHDNFELQPHLFPIMAPYVAASAALALVFWPAAGLNRVVWRFSNLFDYISLTCVLATIVAGTVAVVFAYNRLDGIGRSIPVLQFLAATAFLTGMRSLHKLSHQMRQDRKATAAFLQLSDEAPAETALVVGISRLTEVYLQAIADFSPRRIRIAGLVGRAGRHSGRLLATQPVLGVPENIGQILDNLHVHGIQVDSIIVTAARQSLSLKSREALKIAESQRAIRVRFLAEALGLDCENYCVPQQEPEAPLDNLRFEIPANELKQISARRFWIVKRTADCLAALSLLIILSPLMLTTALLVALSLGSPVVFWQQRPGLGSRPFRLYKFRSMKTAYLGSGRLLGDDERASTIGNILRRLRLDELPQLFNILKGDMSFVGPRPLLPKDQSDAYRARLMVRPGLTGWAQVAGGRDLSSEDKAALDVWYVRNASLLLDAEIAVRTVPVVLFGERISVSLVDRAWRELSEDGVLRGDSFRAERNDLRVIGLQL